MTARFVRIVATNGLAYPCTPGSPFPDVPTAGAVSPTSPAVPATFDPEDFIEQGYGTGPRCIQCRRNVSACHCDDEDIDVPHVEDMKRIMPRVFNPLWKPEGWNRVEA